MFISKILLQRRFPISDIQVEHVTETRRKIDSDVKSQIDKVRTEQFALRENSGKPVWDGEFYRIENIEDLRESDGPITLKLNTINYRYIFTMNEFIEYYKASEERRTNHFSTAAMVKTTDGKYIFGKRSRNGTIDMIGGGTQPSELVLNKGQDIENNLLKEILEETGIGKEDIDSIEGLGFVFSYKSNILLIADAKLSLDCQGVLDKFEGRKDAEMAELVFVDETDVVSYMHSMASYRPHVPTLMGMKS